MSDMVRLNGRLSDFEQERMASNEKLFDLLWEMIGHKIQYERGTHICHGIVRGVGGFRGGESLSVRVRNINSDKVVNVDYRAIQVVLS